MLFSSKITILLSLYSIIDSKEVFWNTSLGTLVGYTKISLSGFEFYAFEGIPFAKPPLGDLRFKAPVPADPWTGILNATHISNHCIQVIQEFKIPESESEDCLYLNLYTRNLRTGPISDVLFTVFGGKYQTGNIKYLGPDLIMDEENLIFVNLNYRLNIFGFISFLDPTVEVFGNAGAKDIVLGLQWIQHYIHEFGGDPRKVTISGCSSSGHLVSLLTLHPLASKLFRHTIAQSGSFLLDQYTLGDGSYEVLAYYANYTGDVRYEKSFYQHLRQMPPEQLVDAYRRFSRIYDSHGFRYQFYITIESTKNNPSPFLSEYPDQIVLQRKFNPIPYLTSFAQFEGGAFNDDIRYYAKNFTNFLCFVPNYLKKYFTQLELESINQEVKEFYYGKEVANEENYYTLLLLSGDSFYNYLNFLAVKMMAHVTNYSMPIYVYEFNIRTRLNSIATAHKLKLPYCTHCDELGYLFSKDDLVDLKVKDYKTEPNVISYIKILTKIIVNFVRTGRPNSYDLTNFDWKPIESTHIDYLVVQSNLTYARDPFGERMKFWHRLYRKYVTPKKLPFEIFNQNLNLFP